MMFHTPDKPAISSPWRNKLLASALGASVLVGLPVKAQLTNYPPMIFFQPLAYPNYPQRDEQGDLAESLAKNSNLKNLAAEIETAGLTEQLKQGRFTVLAPRDDAFDALSNEAFEKFIQPENRTKVLQYHLIPGEVTEADLARGEVTTLAGETIKITQTNNSQQINNATAYFPPTVASNGVIIEIDQVLLPSGF